MSEVHEGDRFGKLVVLNEVPSYIAPSGGVHRRYRCMCDCGSTVDVLKEHLTSGRTKSCGCLKGREKTHGEIHTRLYRIWGNMVNRCTNQNNPAWYRYGGRGITVCDEWKNYEAFRDWAVSNGYRDDLTIDRVDNDKGYSSSNCRWATVTEQNNNTRRNHLLSYNGETKTMAEWSCELEIPYKTLHRRIKSLHWDVEKALTQPVRTQKNSDNS